MIPLPDSVQVGAHTYTIELVNEAMMRSWTDNEPGHVDHKNQIIRLNDKLPHTGRITVLIHEILHIVSHAFSNGQLDEDVVDRISEGFGQALLSLGADFQFPDEELE